MNALKLGAIALTLIIACPIILGFGLASDDTEVTRTIETGSTSLTEKLLNSESDYYIDYNKTNNNSNMIQRITDQGDTYYVYTSPDYVSTGSNESSMPVYSTSDHTDLLTSTTRTESDTIPSVPNSPGGDVLGSSTTMQADWPNYGGRVINTYNAAITTKLVITTSGNSYVFIEGLTDTSYSSDDPANAGGIQADTIVGVFDEDNAEWIYEVNGITYRGEWAYICNTGISGTVTVTFYDYATISPTYNGDPVSDWHYDTSDYGLVRITSENGTISYYTTKSVSHTDAYTIINDTNVGKPTQIEFSYRSSAVLTYYTKTFSTYADPSYGWANATSSFPIHYNAWYNQYENASVTFYVHFDGDGQTVFYEDFSMTAPIITLKRVGGSITAVGGDRLLKVGTYDTLQVVFDALGDTVTVGGVSSFPPVGQSATILNSVTVPYGFDGYIETLVITDQYATISDLTATYYVNNNSTLTFDYNNPYYVVGFMLFDESGVQVTNGYSASYSAPTVTFSPTSLTKGVYTLKAVSLQIQAPDVTIAIDSGTVTTSPITYRVDNARIVAGDYPSTKDYTLNLWNLYPGEASNKVYFNSIGAYGSSITIAGVSYPVTDGRITVVDNGQSVVVPLLKSSIIMRLAGGQYTTTINGHQVASSASAPVIYFAGEWSLTATRSTIGEETVIESHWSPGNFALDTNGFVLVMVLTAVAAFVVLGMTGARSGSKVALLALICGGAAAIGLIIL